MKKFLLGCHEVIQREPFVAVVGNEAADLDSICSALLLAYQWSERGGSIRGTNFVPVVGGIGAKDRCSRVQVVSMRGEVKVVLEHLDCDVKSLVYLYDILPHLDRCIGLVLVDHNSLDVCWSLHPQLASIPVLGIIDHRELNAESIREAPDIWCIETCASCMSLVIPMLSSTIDARILEVAKAVVAWDSLDFKYRFTETDRHAVSSLEDIAIPESLSREALASQSVFASPAMLLQKDLKTFRLPNGQPYTIAVIREPIDGAFAQEAEALQTPCFILATFYTDAAEPVASLHVELYIPRAFDIGGALLNAIDCSKEARNCLTLFTLGDSLRTCTGRKQLQPILHRLLSGSE